MYVISNVTVDETLNILMWVSYNEMYVQIWEIKKYVYNTKS